MPATISPGLREAALRPESVTRHPGLPGDSPRERWPGQPAMPTHAEQRVLPYTPEQLFALVADVERYPEFLPWCVGARVRETPPDLIVADLIIGFRMFRERFTSRVKLDPPHRIDVAYTEGPFKYLNNHWIFERVPGGCRIDFFVDFEFKSKILQRSSRCCSTRRCAAWWRPSKTARSSSTAPRARSGEQAGIDQVERASACSNSSASTSAACRTSLRSPGNTRRSTFALPSRVATPR